MNSVNQRVAIIGNGGWGTALGMVLTQAGHSVTVWGHSDEEIEAIRVEQVNTPYLPNVKLPSGMAWTTDRDLAAGQADIVVIAAPSRFYRSVVESFAGIISPESVVISVGKGFDHEGQTRLSESANAVLGRDDVVVLSGPSHAEEVARGIPTAVVIASANHDTARYLQSVFRTERFRVYTSEDVVGVELGGALKNVIAVAVGASDGLGFGDNTRAALIARGLAEMTRLGCALGASAETFAGLSGLGDLVVTCTSAHSRNRNVGERLGKGETIEAIRGGMKQVAEGIDNCDVSLALARKHRVDVPITEAVYNVVEGTLSPKDAVRDLMLREARPEID